ncbi:MAG: hypothetical protein P1U63_03420 [Coxiellaceae bacterium]|nr:hypothetical protein [Coxiellaceae bacterium]
MRRETEAMQYEAGGWSMHTWCDTYSTLVTHAKQGHEFKLRINLSHTDFQRFKPAMIHFLEHGEFRAAIKGFKHPVLSNDETKRIESNLSDEYISTGQFTLYLQNDAPLETIHHFVEQLNDFLLNTLKATPAAPMATDSPLHAMPHISMRLERTDGFYHDSENLATDTSLIENYQNVVKDTVFYRHFCTPTRGPLPAGRHPEVDHDDIHKLLQHGYQLSALSHQTRRTDDFTAPATIETRSIDRYASCCQHIAMQCRQFSQRKQTGERITLAEQGNSLYDPLLPFVMQNPVSVKALEKCFKQTFDSELPVYFQLLKFRQYKRDHAPCVFGHAKHRQTLAITNKLINVFINKEKMVTWSAEEIKACQQGDLGKLIKDCHITVPPTVVFTNPAYARTTKNLSL